MSSNTTLIEQFNRLKADTSLDDESRYARMNEIAERLINSTIDCYNNAALTYNDLRSEINTHKRLSWEILSDTASQYLPCDGKIKILDVSAGNGRDLIYGRELGYDMYGTELSDTFLNLLNKLHSDGATDHKVKKCDMRKLDFDDASFDVVRHCCTLLHMPVIGKGYTADKALAEAHRILKNNGLLYIEVKEGPEDLKIHNTNDGLGDRICQFFSVDILREVVERNGFEILLTKKTPSNRAHEPINFLVVIARKM